MFAWEKTAYQSSVVLFSQNYDGRVASFCFWVSAHFLNDRCSSPIMNHSGGRKVSVLVDDENLHGLRIILIGELSSSISTFVSRSFSIFPIFPICFPNVCVKFNELDLFASGFWRISRTVTERHRILMQISNYFQTLETDKKTLSDKNEPEDMTKNTAKTKTHPTILV